MSDPAADLQPWLRLPWGDVGIAWVDVETTGLDPATAEIVEVAVVVSPGRGEPPVLALSERVRPAHPIPPEATAVHGITDDDVADAPSWADVRPGVIKAIGERPWGAYNAPFDAGFLGLDLTYAVDAMVPVGVVDRYRSGKRLSDVARRRGVILDAHGAAGDAVACAIVWPMMLRELRAKGEARAIGTWEEWLAWERKAAIAGERDTAAWRASKGLPWSAPWCDFVGVDVGVGAVQPAAPTHRVGQGGRIEPTGAP